MINLKLKINYEELQHFQKSLHLMFRYAQEDEDFSYLDFYNISSLLKKLLDKIFRYKILSYQRCTVSININEHASMIPLFFKFRKVFPAETSIYLSTLWMDILSQLDREKMQAETRQKALYFNPLKNII